MAKDIVISVNNVSKDFILPHERKNTLKEAALHFKRSTSETFHALKDINFEVQRGEFFGIVGRNGSGKSTLLKVVGGIYQPTKGVVQVKGTLTPFIELGIGFNPELTGRENIFLNGAILGLSRKEVIGKYDEIVDFAELEQFMDQKLKNYSSGMQVRLAFSIAMQAHNDVLLIDEVLAVGDAAFQTKCLKVFEKIKRDKTKTVLFVTHDMESVRRFCDRAIMIENSVVTASGAVIEVVDRYIDANLEKVKNSMPFGSDGVKTATQAKQAVIKNVGFARLGERYSITLDILAIAEVSNIVPGVVVRNQSGIMVTANNTIWDKVKLPPLAKGERLQVSFTFDNVLEKGNYLISANIVDGDDMITFIDWKNDVTSFSVERPYLTGGTTFANHTIKYTKG